MTDKMIPHNLEAEQAVLGSVLINSGCLMEVRAELQASDFWYPGHRRLFGAMVKLQEAGEPVNLITLMDLLADRKGDEDYGVGDERGSAYLAKLVGAVPTHIWAASYARVVRGDSVRRHLIEVAGKIAGHAYQDETVEDAVNTSRDLLSKVAAPREGDTVSMKDAVTEAYPYFQECIATQRVHYGMSTGLVDLDRIIGGLEAEYFLIAARPSHGKSSLAIQIAAHVAGTGRGVAFFSLEMGPRQVVERLACAKARVDSSKLKVGKLLPDEQARFWNAMTWVQGLPIWWSYEGVSVHKIVAEVKRLQTQHDIGLVVIDYLQLVTARGENENVRVGSVSRELKLLSVGSDVCVLALSQLNRAVESRENKVPMLADLRASGSLEQDADKVLVLHTEMGKPSDAAGITQMVLRKNRNGPTGTGGSGFVFLKAFARFEDKARP